MDTTVDLRPLLDLGMDYIAEILLVLVSAFVVPRLQKWLGLKLDAERRAALDLALNKAAAWGLAKAREHAAGVDTDVDVKNLAVATAVRYARDSVPDALAYFKITPGRLAEMIEARLAPSPFEVELLKVETQPEPAA